MEDKKAVADAIWKNIADQPSIKDLREAAKPIRPYVGPDFDRVEKQVAINLVGLQKQEIDALQKEVHELKVKADSDSVRAEKHEHLRITADAMYRFLCGLNLQDHPVADQRQFLVLMRQLKTQLQEVGDGTSGD